MEVVMAAKPKRIREFIINGHIYAGGAEEYYSGQRNPIGNNLGGVRDAEGVQSETAGEETKDKE